MATPPKWIVLATDLSGAGDRALDRATGLGVEWDAELVVVHALDDSARTPDLAALASAVCAPVCDVTLRTAVP